MPQHPIANGVVTVDGKRFDLKVVSDRYSFAQYTLKNPRVGDFIIRKDSLGNPEPYYLDMYEPGGATMAASGYGSTGGRHGPTDFIMSGVVAVIPFEIWSTQKVKRGSREYDLRNFEDMKDYVRDVTQRPAPGDWVILGEYIVAYLGRVGDGLILIHDQPGESSNGIQRAERISAPFVMPK